jgi:hypothetical protein
MTQAQYVFGYGSLVERSTPTDGTRVTVPHYHLRGYRRSWGVAMENRSDLPNYKHYLADDGERPDVFVVFLNVQPAGGHRVNGTLLEVSSSDLVELDSRERSYNRVNITKDIEPRVEGVVWTYVGGPDAVARFERGLREGRAIVDQNYFDDVKNRFEALGEEVLREYEALTELPPCPTVPLTRVDR